MLIVENKSRTQRDNNTLYVDRGKSLKSVGNWYHACVISTRVLMTNMSNYVFPSGEFHLASWLK